MYGILEYTLGYEGKLVGDATCGPNLAYPFSHPLLEAVPGAKSGWQDCKTVGLKLCVIGQADGFISGKGAAALPSVEDQTSVLLRPGYIQASDHRGAPI